MAERRLTLAQVPDGPRPLPARYLTPLDVAELLAVPIETVYQWRRKRTGPRGFRVGRHLRYDPADVRTWVESLMEGAVA
ncbi:helix-turn-helix domain-containing protein [Streptomyces sp. NPDC005244]|uniref:helix-turn-helix domain-containing protein n=1 Tax=Streptomyces sp. NPDC005244 TaxID=3364708 RepID=UPI0036C5BC92